MFSGVQKVSDFKFTPKQEAWLQALESGEYKQGRGFLVVEDRFCCLGVACALNTNLRRMSDGFEDSYRRCTRALPDAVQVGLGLTDNGAMKLTYMNDSIVNHKNFKEIATEMRNHPERFFKHGTDSQ